MRSILGWILLAVGVAIALTGFCDAGMAWLGQHPAVYSADTRETLPPGFAARLIIPRLDSSLFVIHAKRPRDLRLAPGYIEGSVKPGDAGNCIIAGHRDLHFRVLKDIRVGDEIQLITERGPSTYRVAATQIVSPRDRNALRAVYPQQLTLVTCYPFYYVGPAPKRFIVTAYRLEQS